MEFYGDSLGWSGWGGIADYSETPVLIFTDKISCEQVFFMFSGIFIKKLPTELFALFAYINNKD